MKQQINLEQWNSLSKEQQERLIPLLVGAGGQLSIVSCIEFIRHHHQLDIYTVNEDWCIQLFDLSDCANDEVDCIYENSSIELIDVLFMAMLWILDRLMDS